MMQTHANPSGVESRQRVEDKEDIVLSANSGVNTTSEDLQKRGRWWPWMLVGLLLFGAGTNIYMVVVAVRDPSFAVETNYYQKALTWDQTMEQERVNLRLGWNVSLQTQVVKGKKQQLVLQAKIQDNQGQVVPNTKVSVEAFHNARAQHRLQRNFAQTTQGIHRASIPFSRKGIWLFYVTVERGKERFTQQIRRDI